MLKGKVRTRKPGGMNSFLMIIIQIGIIDIVFSLDSVFTAVGLAKHIEVMVAAIVISVLVMMVISVGGQPLHRPLSDDQGPGAGVLGAGRRRADRASLWSSISRRDTCISRWPSRQPWNG